VETVRDQEGNLLSVSELIPPLAEVVAKADGILAIARPDGAERAVLNILDATTTLPLTRDAAIEVGVEVATEHEAERALNYLEALHLAFSAQSEDGTIVVYNPNIWAMDVDFSKAALRAEDSKARAALSGLMEEIAQSPGLPEEAVTSASHAWIDYAVSQGLVHRCLVVTSEGHERAFLFTPHMGRNAFAEPTRVDPSGHVRQLIGSMVYAKNFATYNLYWPATYLRSLIRNGEAGDASSIASDYPMLETAGIVRVEKAERFYKLVLLQSDIAEQAVEYLEDPGTAESSQVPGLRDQRRYIQPEQERARKVVQLGRTADTRPAETRRLLAALRQAAGGRDFGR
jgi:hypothetical protein